MIGFKDGIFTLETESTSYIFRITDCGHPEHIHYGDRVDSADAEALSMKNTFVLGSSVDYTEERPGYSLDNLLLEYSGIGKGDYRHSPTELMMPDGSFVTDFVYHSHKIEKGAYKSPELPTAYGDAETLTIILKDKKYHGIELHLIYTVFYASNVICRATELHNGSEGFVYIRKLMSLMLDLAPREFDMITFDGSWAKEAHLHRRAVEAGILVNDSTTGASSNRHNPGFLLSERDADSERGRVLGFNLIYSGNHYSAVERGPYGTVRVMSGINPHCFLWRLAPGEAFYAPEAVMTFGEHGFNSVMHNMHAFVNANVVRGEHKGADRPIVLNNWEATFFNFNRRKLHSLARRAKKLGVETFVLDDGWFGKRNSDKAGLGDWSVNEKKLPGGIKALSKKINSMGMKFGLWFEPECVNPDSDLFRAHPDWILKVPEREASMGRNQYVLDLTRPEVRSYIVESVSRILTESNVEYVKWDYNRHISDPYSGALKNQGELYHRYILGLYEVLGRIFHERHKNVLLESCSSGGNRFDLGMLCYSPEIWTSDDTDPIERLDIQGGMYYLYPPSTVSAHVSMSPHQQTLRQTPLSTRFNVSAFGVLGYELDLDELTPAELREIKSQIEFYKKHRRTLQYGELKIVKCEKPHQISWQITSGKETVIGLFQTHAHACDPRDSLRMADPIPDTRYLVESVGAGLDIRRFGALIKHVLPISLSTDGFILRTVARHYQMTDGSERYECSGRALASGIGLAMQYAGTGYHRDLRILGDFGSSLYLITEKENENKGEDQ